ncbi:MAG: CDGSH iron-sulfur domain-containing protein [Gemmatimonadetes bacterium]|nr:CDGSH iron-sulfur domain-containing protein [Gemmatimonadota bacterium]
MAEIIVRRNGPYRVFGPIVLKDHDGNVIETKDVFTLCRCGHSQTKPFCDGTHKIIGFVDPTPAEPPAVPPAAPPPA